MVDLSLQKDKIAYISDARGNPDLFVQSFNIHQGAVGKPYQLFASPGSAQASPSFSPDGKKIAFVSDKDGCPRIYTISLESSNRDIQLITKRNKENICPSWSPDGKKLAYSAKTNGIRQIWLYDFTTGEERQLTYGQGIKENPSFAPNSLHVVFNITEGEQTNLCIMHIEQKEFTKISEGSGVKHYPTWMGE